MKEGMESSLYFLSVAPSLDELCSINVAMTTSSSLEASSGQGRGKHVIKCREIISTDPNVIATPLPYEDQMFLVVLQQSYYKTGRLLARLNKLGLQAAQPRRVTVANFEACLHYTVMARLSPTWCQFGEYLVKGEQFLTSFKRMDAVKMLLTVNKAQVYLSVQVYSVFSPLFKVQDLDISFTSTKKFVEDGVNGCIGENELTGLWCHILPSLKKGRFVCVRRSLPKDCPFARYDDIKQYWKDMHGYKLPDVEADMYYVQIFFRSISGVLFTYPSCCIRASEPVVSRHPHPSAVTSSLLDDISSRVGSLCGCRLTFDPPRLTNPSLSDIKQIGQAKESHLPNLSLEHPTKSRISGFTPGTLPPSNPSSTSGLSSGTFVVHNSSSTRGQSSPTLPRQKTSGALPAYNYPSSTGSLSTTARTLQSSESIVRSNAKCGAERPVIDLAFLSSSLESLLDMAASRSSKQMPLTGTNTSSRTSKQVPLTSTSVVSGSPAEASLAGSNNVINSCSKDIASQLGRSESVSAPRAEGRIVPVFKSRVAAFQQRPQVCSVSAAGPAPLVPRFLCKVQVGSVQRRREPSVVEGSSELVEKHRNTSDSVLSSRSCYAKTANALSGITSDAVQKNSNQQQQQVSQNCLYTLQALPADRLLDDAGNAIELQSTDASLLGNILGAKPAIPMFALKTCTSSHLRTTAPAIPTFAQKTSSSSAKVATASQPKHPSSSIVVSKRVTAASKPKKDSVVGNVQRPNSSLSTNLKSGSSSSSTAGGHATHTMSAPLRVRDDYLLPNTSHGFPMTLDLIRPLAQSINGQSCEKSRLGPIQQCGGVRFDPVGTLKYSSAEIEQATCWVGEETDELQEGNIAVNIAHSAVQKRKLEDESSECEMVAKKPRAKPKIQDNVNVEHLARTFQLKSVNAVTLMAWLKERGVACKCKDKKTDLEEKVLNYLSLKSCEQ